MIPAISLLRTEFKKKIEIRISKWYLYSHVHLYVLYKWMLNCLSLIGPIYLDLCSEWALMDSIVCPVYFYLWTKGGSYQGQGPSHLSLTTLSIDPFPHSPGGWARSAVFLCLLVDSGISFFFFLSTVCTIFFFLIRHINIWLQRKETCLV